MIVNNSKISVNSIPKITRKLNEEEKIKHNSNGKMKLVN